MMRISIILCGPVLIATMCLGVAAQVPTPVRPDPFTDNENIKTRSIELERVKRESDKRDTYGSVQTSTATFVEIGQDFEKIQKLQNAIVSIYTRSKVIDFEKLALNAGALSSTGIRLKMKLFPESNNAKDERISKDKKSESVTTAVINGAKWPLPTDVETLIVELDNELSAFVSNPIFANPKVVDLKDNLKAEALLERMILLSAALRESAARSTQK